jgi:hypothetical protein
MVPSNLTDFVSQARLWMRLRGFCPDEPSIIINSFAKWRLAQVAHSKTVDRGNHLTRQDIVMWRTLTVHLLRLQLDLHRDVAVLGEKLVDTLRDYAFPRSATCDTATLIEYQRLCSMISDHSVSEPFFSGEQHSDLDGEQGTFPDLLLTAAPCHDGAKNVTLVPNFKQSDVDELRLPELEDQKFFYYFKNDVGLRVFEKLFPLTPLKRASLLKMVDVF